MNMVLLTAERIGLSLDRVDSISADTFALILVWQSIHIKAS